MKKGEKIRYGTGDGKVGLLSRAFGAIKDFNYALKVKIHSTLHKSEKTKPINAKSKKVNEIIFLVAILFLPVLKFCIFYVYVNFNSIIMAFQSYNTMTNEWSFIGIQNFIDVFTDLFLSSSGPMLIGLKNSMILYFSGLIIGTPLGLFFSYYIYKKIFGSQVFQIILFLPSIIPSLVMILLFKYFIEDGVSALIGFNLLTAKDTSFATMIFYSQWTGFGSGIILYSNAMSKISPELEEYAQIEGITPLQEFLKISFPMIYPTFTVLVVSGVSGIFISNGATYAFFSDTAPVFDYTMGYYLFVMVIGDNATMADYPYASAAGLMLTLVCVPLTMLVRWAMERFGPSED